MKKETCHDAEGSPGVLAAVEGAKCVMNKLSFESSGHLFALAASAGQCLKTMK